jgi:hypothetical protein
MNAAAPFKFLANGEYDQSAYDEHIVSAAEKLMERGAKCDPLDPENFDEALSEVLAGLPSSGIARTLAVALRDGAPVNKLLIDMADKYWHGRALDQAKDDMQDERERAAEDRAESRKYWLTH